MITVMYAELILETATHKIDSEMIHADSYLDKNQLTLNSDRMDLLFFSKRK